VLLSSAVLLCAAAPAPAAVEIGPDRIVVTGDDARAVITRVPFRMRFEDGAGRTVLEQVANTGQAPQPIPPTADPEPLGTDAQRRPTLYAPMTFTIGAERSVQYPGTQYAGNQIVGTQGGIQYSARDVVDAAPEGEGVRLVVATSDGDRQLVVVVRPDRAGSIRVTARPTPDDGVAVMGDSFASGDGERFQGFGGRTNAIDQRGQEFFNWLEEENFGCGMTQATCDPLPGGQREKYKFPGGPHGAYHVQSLFVSSRPYGFMLDRTELSHWRMASDRPDAWQVQVAAAGLDYLVTPGDGKTAVRKLTELTGRHGLPPDWSLGSQTSRLISPNSNAARYEAQVRDDLREIDRNPDLPMQVYDLFGWELLPRETTRDLIREFNRRGIRVLAYFKCFVSQDTVGYDNPRAFPEAIEKGLVATLPDGRTPYLFTPPFVGVGGAALLDFTKEETREWWTGRIEEALDLGFDGFMHDFGEQVQVDMRFSDGSTGAAMHNAYPYAYHRLTRSILDRYMREHPGRELWMYTRSGYSGTPGSTADEGSNFPGDNETAFSRSNGLASMAPDMLNRTVGGAWGFTTDIGGYGDYVTPPTTAELLVRWAQAAALSPFFRLHNSANSETRQPWFFDDPAVVRRYADAARLKLAAAPLLKRLWGAAVGTGVPPIRPLWLEFPDDAEAAKQDQQWMLGPDVLVAPVVEEGATSRDVYFPRGEWVHPETGERFSGPRTVEFAAPIDRLPYFFRAGTSPFAAPADLGLPSARRCASRRRFAIRLRDPRGDRLVRARVSVDGRRVRVTRRGGRLRAVVDLRGRPRGRSEVRILGVGRSGRRYVATRRYRTCGGPRRVTTPERPRRGS
jgi:alpha-D-xyloside xylohydrolase